jgi:hypothetical protein
VSPLYPYEPTSSVGPAPPEKGHKRSTQPGAMFARFTLNSRHQWLLRSSG